MTAATLATVAVVVFFTMLGLGSVAAVVIAKAIADANADDCGLATDDSEWCLECEGPCRFEGEL